MRYNNKKIKLSVGALQFLILSYILTGCSNGKTVDKPTTDNNSEGNSGATISDSITAKQININEARCSGCGRCANIDPEHFVLDSSSRKARVVAKSNLGSTSLAVAIASCRNQAISLD